MNKKYIQDVIEDFCDRDFGPLWAHVNGKADPEHYEPILEEFAQIIVVRTRLRKVYLLLCSKYPFGKPQPFGIAVNSIREAEEYKKCSGLVFKKDYMKVEVYQTIDGALEERKNIFNKD